jgi:hydroxymethylpyrimidine/phosphomethylpyrimidine kinase
LTARILIIAGSDSGGGAGIQADIKTVTMLGGHAMTAITAITAQNTLGVQAVHPVPTGMVIAQIDSVVSDIGVDAVKIGMIGSAETANAVADRLAHLSVPIIFDPVMVATSGSLLTDGETIAAFERLMRIASLVTPNLPELEALGGEAALFGPTLIKGGHGEGDIITDRLVGPEGEIALWSGNRIDTTSTHGTGCTLASAIACGVANGYELFEAIEQARYFVRMSLRSAPNLGYGHGPMGQQAVRLDCPVNDSNYSPMLNQVTVLSSDYDASVSFYKRLGLTQIVDDPPNYARFETLGGGTFSIEAVTKGISPQATIYFEFERLDDVIESMKSNGVNFDLDVKDQPWLWREARLRDPFGNRICLYKAGENRRYPPWRL